MQAKYHRIIAIIPFDCDPLVDATDRYEQFITGFGGWAGGSEENAARTAAKMAAVRKRRLGKRRIMQ
jgi:hypothetical protein